MFVEYLEYSAIQAKIYIFPGSVEILLERKRKRRIFEHRTAAYK